MCKLFAFLFLLIMKETPPPPLVVEAAAAPRATAAKRISRPLASVSGPARYPCAAAAKSRVRYAARPSHIRPESPPACAHKSLSSIIGVSAKRGANAAFFGKRNVIALPNIIQAQAFHHKVMQGRLAGFNQRQ